MPRRYYYDDDQAANEFAGWALTLTGMALVELIKALRPRPAAYTPEAPDIPKHVNLLTQGLAMWCGSCGLLTGKPSNHPSLICPTSPSLKPPGQLRIGRKSHR